MGGSTARTLAGATRSVAALVLPSLLAAACGRASRLSPESIRIAVPYELSTLDPHARNTVSSFAILSNIYEALVTKDPDMGILPSLAETWENPDALTWVFHLRPHAKFHTGKPVTAADVVFSINRLLRDETLEMRTFLQHVQQVDASDTRTVVIRTNRPYRILLNKLSFVLIVPQGFSPPSSGPPADGSGPYQLVDWMPGQRIRLRRIEGHWTRPMVQDVEFALGCSPEDAIDGLLSGRYQLVQCNTKKAESLVRPPRYRVIRHDNIYVKFLGYDLARQITPFCSVAPNPFRNKKVRRALALGLDRRRLLESLSTYGAPAAQPVPRFIFGFDPAIPEPRHDRERALATLREAGLEGGFEVTLHTRQILSEAAAQVKEQLGSIGVRVDVRTLPDPDFFDAVNHRNASLWLSRWGCPSGDVSDLLDMYVHSADSLRQWGVNNYSGYSDPEMDRRIESAAGIEKPEDRRQALQRIVRTLMEELVLIPLYNDQDVYAFEASLAWRPRNDSYIRAAEIGPAHR